MSRDGRRALLRVRDLHVLDSFQFFGPNQTPATLSYRVDWTATEPFTDRGRGAAVDPTDPAAFLGRLATARSTCTFSASEWGFSARSDGALDTARGGFAELGRERNGIFLA